MQKMAGQRRIEKLAKKLASAKTISKEAYIDKYFSELPEKTKTFTLEVKDRNFGVWALRMPTEDFREWIHVNGNSRVTKIEYSNGMKRASESRKPSIKFRQI